MTIYLTLFLLCPIPEDQKPITEYIGLKENPLTNWTTLSNQFYVKKIRYFFLVIFLFTSFLNLGELDLGLIWIANNLFITTLIFIIFCLLIRFRWSELQKKLNSPRLFYEEISWYDGEIWDKPMCIIKNDRLISTQKITPILIRLQRTTWFFAYVSFLNFLFLII